MGQVFEIQLSETGQSAGSDRLYFYDATCASRMGQDYGFAISPYQARSSDGIILWESTARSETEGTAVWKGKILGERIQGTLVWSKEGHQPVEYTFVGKRLPPLYERLGGVDAIATVVDDFIERLLVNDVLNANPAIYESRQRVQKAGLKYQFTSLVCQVTGGPENYTGRTMKAAHAHLHIGEKEWQAMLADFKATLDHFKVPSPEQAELFAILESTKAEIVVQKSEK